MDEPTSFEDQFYTDIILQCALFATIVVSIKHKNKFRILKNFPVYSGSFLVVMIINRLCTNNHIPNLLFPLSTFLDYFFTLLELIIFSNFYHQLIKNHTVKRLIIVSNLLFVLFFIFMGVRDKNFYHQGISEKTQSIVYTVEGIILLFLCSFYYFELFKRLHVINLKNEPVFWVSTGLFFFVTCTLPYSLLENYIDKYYPNYSFMLYSLFYLFYILLFIMIMRAYLCKLEMTK